MKRIPHIINLTIPVIILAGFLSCRDNSVAPTKQIPHFPVIFHFVDKSDSTIMYFNVHCAVYFPKQDSLTYLYTGEGAPYGHGNWLIGHVVDDSITKTNAITEPYLGCKAGLVIIAQKFWQGDNGHNIPTWRAWQLKERVISNPDSNVVSFTWPNDTLSPNVEYLGYVNQ